MDPKTLGMAFGITFAVGVVLALLLLLFVWGFFDELKYCVRMGLGERREKKARKEREEVRRMLWWGWDERYH